MDDTKATRAMLAQARYLGADAALAAATWLEMSEPDARSWLTDVDPMVIDRYPEPTLSGEFTDDPTPMSLAVEITGHLQCAELRDALADAWESGRDLVWSDAVSAHALRVLGKVDAACDLERHTEAKVAELRKAAER